MDFDQELIDKLQAALFRDKLRNVEPRKLEEAARRVARNTDVGQRTTDPPAQNDGTDKRANKTGSFRTEDVLGDST